MNRVRFGLVFATLIWSAIGWGQTPSSQNGSVHATELTDMSEGGTLYDDFNSPWLDPAKWQIGTPQCWVTLECIREIQNGQLRLAVRVFGATNSDSGIGWSAPEVRFINPNVKSIKADVTAHSFSGIGCATNNTDYTHTEIRLWGTFFNIGTGNAADDVTAFLLIWVDTFNPQTMSVVLWWGYNWGSGQGFAYPVASYPFGTPLTLSLKWDEDNHQFIARSKPRFGESPGKQIAVPYNVSATTPSTSPSRGMDVSTNSLNCTSGRTYAQVEPKFDNVIVNW